MQVTLHVPSLRQYCVAIQGILGHESEMKYHLPSQKNWIVNCPRQELAGGKCFRPLKILALLNYGFANATERLANGSF